MGEDRIKEDSQVVGNMSPATEAVESGGLVEGSNVGAETKPIQIKKPQSPRKTRKLQLQYFYGNDNHQRKNSGMRKTRRSETLSYLVSQANEEDLEDPWTDLMEHTTSSFDELFLEESKMQAWNDFVNSSEEEQQNLLSGVADKEDAETMEKEDFEYLDKRDVHPAFSAKECFAKMDSKMQQFLRGQRLPWGMLSAMEEELTDFFRQFPKSVLVSRISSSYERILLHALCQFLHLQSFSFDDDSGTRQTQVENRKEHFYPPEVSLVNYLKSLRQEC